MRFIGLVLLLTVGACDALTGVRPDAKAACVARSDTTVNHSFVTPHGDTVLVGPHSGGTWWQSVTVDVPCAGR